jgi:hypothetical protein
MIPAGFSELKKAFNKHSSVASLNTGPSYFLLLFYAVECGVKSIYLTRNRLRTTEDISDLNLRGSHDLAAWAKELRLPANLTDGIPREIRLDRDGNNYQIGEAHQAWRYGIVLEAENEQSVIEWLKKIEAWIKENIN